jgi:hypothetical protein
MFHSCREKCWEAQAGEKGRRCLEQALLPRLDALLAAADEDEGMLGEEEEQEEEDEDEILGEYMMHCLQEHQHGGHTIGEAAALQGAGWLLPWLVAWRVRAPQHSGLLIRALCQVCARLSGKPTTPPVFLGGSESCMQSQWSSSLSC